MKLRFYLKKRCNNVLMLHVNEIKNTEMDKLVRLTVHLSQQPISHDGRRQMLKTGQDQRKKLPVLPQNILPTLQYWQLTSLSKMSFLYRSGQAFFLVFL